MKLRLKLKMKSYIKPFEKKLALMELSHLANIDETELSDSNIYEIEIDEKRIEKDLIRKLAYWECVGKNLENITEQAAMESTYECAGDYSQLCIWGKETHELQNTRILRYGVHDIHEYKGKFFPQLVRACINIAGIEDGSLVFDPFCGSGTTLCEGMVRGMRTAGIDLNPLSILISKVKTGILNVDGNDIISEYKRISANLQIYKKEQISRWNVNDLKYLSNWFAGDALEDINCILSEAESVQNEIIRNFFKVNLSNILREISWQKESDLRVRKDIKEYKKGDAQRKFCAEVNRQLNRIIPYLSVVKRINCGTSHVIEGNTRYVLDETLKEECDVIITSPPYATALPYLDTDRLSIIVLGLMHRSDFSDKNLNMIGNREVTEKQRKELWSLYQQRRGELTQEICVIIDKIAESNHKDGVGFRRRNLPALLAKYFLDMLDSMNTANELLKSGAKAFYVVGNNSTKIDDETYIIETNKLLWNLAEKVGWKKVRYIDMEMLEGTAGYRNNPGTAEAILIFEKQR